VFSEIALMVHILISLALDARLDEGDFCRVFHKVNNMNFRRPTGVGQ